MEARQLSVSGILGWRVTEVALITLIYLEVKETQVTHCVCLMDIWILNRWISSIRHGVC